jgi:hypothetical protein
MMICRRCIAPLLLLIGGCAIDFTSGSHYIDRGLSLPDSYYVGDTSTYVVQEWKESLDDHGPSQPPSDQAPDVYRWSSSSPAVAEVIGPGRVRMKAVGQATVTVKTSQASADFSIIVFPQGAGIRITPRGLTVNVGATGSLHAEAVDANGAVLPAIHLGARFWSANIYDYSGTPPGPIARPIIEPLLNTPDYQFTGKLAGQVTVLSRVTVYRRGDLRDSVLVVVH